VPIVLKKFFCHGNGVSSVYMTAALTFRTLNRSSLLGNVL
jgi:hypothetical protein